MRFTRLRLNGFKSFVDPTDLVIAEGLTGVVGPNGCGKSNLLEALRWVMGESRPTAMRGGGMEDVIFAGAATRPARSHAEVMLTIDNSARRAPPGFNDHDQIEIVRRITRDLGSAYRIGAKEVRARDVQMLFADASTGAHSPALVRQGQISELINAQPKARRRLLEEAAGISGLYQRRHEAELRLRGAEQNLARVDDVIGQLAAQLGQLVRQARQAARYREIGAALRQAEGLLLYRRWKEADAARAVAAEQLQAQARQAAQAEAAARAAEQARGKAEAALPALREEETIAAAVLHRLQVAREALDEGELRAQAALEALTKRIAQLERDLEREAALNTDAGESVARLRAEASDLEAAGTGHEARLAEASEAAQEAAHVLAQREEDLTLRTEEMARLSARHQSAQRRLSDGRRALQRSETEAERAQTALQDSQADLERFRVAVASAAEQEQEAIAEAVRCEEALMKAEAARTAAAAHEAEARAQRSAGESAANALRAEVAALTRLVEREAGQGGQILDQVRVAPGYEKALGAALADDLRAPAVTSGAASGWVRLPDYPAPQPLPKGALALSVHVEAPEALARRISQIGIIEPEEAARLQAGLKPGQRLVSLAGDLWRWDGFRAAARDAPSAAALRLQQLNRLAELERDLEEAEARAEEAAQTHEARAQRLAELSAADKAAREARREADRRATDAGRALSRAEAECTRAEGQQESLELTLRRHEDEAAAAGQEVAEAERALAELGGLDAARAELDDLRMTVEAARITMISRRSLHDELRREGEARARRAEAVTKEIRTWTDRLETAAVRGRELAQRRAAATAELAEAAGAPDHIAREREKLAQEIEAAEARRRAGAQALGAGEEALRQASAAERETERAASQAREVRAKAEARAEAAREALIQAAERIEEVLEVTPEHLLETLGADPADMPASEAIENELARLRRQRESLGAVNLRAEEDAQEVRAEHDMLVKEKQDLEQAIQALRTGIANLNREGRERLLIAFEQVNANFGALFTHLFNGGEAMLDLRESDDPLEAGLEIMCQPPGKRLSALSLLSGGEQTLTALALIFAVFLANPAPICVLDEVDAPLDDANVTRFCDLLDEMCRRTETRFLIITHHAVTMSRMDRLFGVTMGEQGVSQLVSVDLKKAEAMVA